MIERIEVRLTHASIPTITACITLTGEGLSISRLEIFYLRRLDVDHWAVASWTIRIIRRSYPKQGFGISMVLSSISFHVGGHDQRELGSRAEDVVKMDALKYY